MTAHDAAVQSMAGALAAEVEGYPLAAARLALAALVASDEVRAALLERIVHGVTGDHELCRILAARLVDAVLAALMPGAMTDDGGA